MSRVSDIDGTRRTVLEMVGIGVGMGLAGCLGDDGEPSPGEPNEDGIIELTALGGVTGGSGYQQCLGLQQVVEESVDDVRMTVSGTDGWGANARRMWETGRDEIGVVPAGHIHDMLYGNDPYDEEGSYVLQMYPTVPPTYIHTVVPQDSSIEAYSDLQDARVNVLPRGALSEELQPVILEALGIEPAEYAHYPHDDAASALRQGDIDAVVGAGAAAAYMELSQSVPLRVLSLPEEGPDQIEEEIEWMTFDEVDFGQYYEGAGEALVPAPWTLMGVLLDVDDELVYELTKAVFENVETIAAIYEAAGDLEAEVVTETRAPVHPGAYEYYEEQGIELPAELEPPNPDELPLEE